MRANDADRLVPAQDAEVNPHDAVKEAGRGTVGHVINLEHFAVRDLLKGQRSSLGGKQMACSGDASTAHIRESQYVSHQSSR